MSRIPSRKSRYSSLGWVSGSEQRAKSPWAERVKGVLRPMLFRTFRQGKKSLECPLCGYVGPFKDKVVNRIDGLIRVNAKCPGCGSMERHRIVPLVLQELFPEPHVPRSLLHFAPEPCLQATLQKYFSPYHTSDLFLPGVDFQEDLQSMSFPDASYDCIFIARVLMIPPNLEACLSEIRRVLKPGGMAFILESFPEEKTIEHGTMRGGWSRILGADFLDLCERHFLQVDRYTSDRYPSQYQVLNEVRLHGKPHDRYPDVIRLPDVGYRELVAVCHA